MHETALITGATSGIGAEFALQLARQGCDLVLVGRREERLRALAAELAQKYAVGTEVLIADLADASGVALVEAKIAALPALDLLVNNAGFGVEGDFAHTALQAHLGMIHVHVVASVRLTYAALPAMLSRRRGAVINVSSVAAFLPYTGGSVTYNATKAYLNMFTQTLSEELRGSGVRVQALCPGFTYTDFHDRPGLETFHRSDYPRFIWLSAESVVKTSLDDLRRGRVISVTGFLYKLLAIIGGTPWMGWILYQFRKRQMPTSRTQ